MECNNILLDYCITKKRKTVGYQGSQLPSAGEGRCAAGLRAGCVQEGIWALWPRWSLGLAPPGPRGTERRGRSAGCSEPPRVLQTFHTSLSIPQESCCL